MPFRVEQVADQIQRELSDIIRLRVSDPRVGPITITRVKVSDDLSFARVFFAELSTEPRKESETLKGLANATGFMRTELGKRMRLRHVPGLRFQTDHTIEDGINLTALIEKVREEDARKASQRMPPSDEP